MQNFNLTFEAFFIVLNTLYYLLCTNILKCRIKWLTRF